MSAGMFIFYMIAPILKILVTLKIPKTFKLGTKDEIKPVPIRLKASSRHL